MASKELIMEGETESWTVQTEQLEEETTSLLAGLHASTAPTLVSMVGGFWFWPCSDLGMRSFNEN